MEEDIGSVTCKVLVAVNRVLKNNPSSLSEMPKLNDELSRFKIWCGSSGASKTGQESLDYRLHEASHLREQVLGHLHDLEEVLEGISGIEHDLDLGDDTEDSDSDDVDRILSEVTDIVNCLLRLSVSVRSPAPRDRFVVCSETGTSVNNVVHIARVREKFNEIDDFLANRLGNAISRRIRYIEYRKSQHKQSFNESQPFEATAERDRAITPVFHDKEYDEAGLEISIVTDEAESVEPEVPSMPEETFDGLFLCPYCLRLMRTLDKPSWRTHIYNDLRPYNCLAEVCSAPDQTFSSSTEWMQHMIQEHLSIYRCPNHCEGSFSSMSDAQIHLLTTHPDTAIELGKEAEDIIIQTSQLRESSLRLLCPLCAETQQSPEQYRRHVGRHQRELALLSLPEESWASENLNSKMEDPTNRQSPIPEHSWTSSEDSDSEPGELPPPNSSLIHYQGTGSCSDLDSLSDHNRQEMPEGSWTCCSCDQDNNVDMCATDESDNMKCSNVCEHTKCDECTYIC